MLNSWPMDAGPGLRVNAVIQARTQSTRLADKVLLPLAGRPVLEWVVDAARASRGVHDVVVATTTSSADDRIEQLCQRMRIPVVRGSESDVLSRFAQAIRAHPCDAVVRLTADCPLLDPDLVGQVVAAWQYDPSLDYVATTLIRTLPRGLDVELISCAALRRLDENAQGYHRSHVTSGAYTDPGRYRLLGLVVEPDYSKYRVTLDTLEDAIALEQLASILPRTPPKWSDLVAILRVRPDIVAINSSVEQKPISAG
jgi:spore coat polysaccharide biosynthesis protein SpsF